MAREPEKTTRLDAATIKLFRQRVKSIDGVLALAETIAANGELWSFKVPSLITGIEKAEAATQEIQRAISAGAMGDPLGPDSRKTYALPRAKQTKKATKKVARKR